MDKHYLSLRYRDKFDNIKDLVVPFPEDEYNDSLSYRENLQIVVSDMYSDGGLWVGENTIIPYHRVICIETHNNEQNENEAPKRDNRDQRRRFFKRRYNKPNNDHQVVKNETQKQPAPPSNDTSNQQPPILPT